MKTTEENNRLIAEFMSGQKVVVHHNQYHVSWNELMPVVENIETLLAEVEIRNCQTKVIGYGKEIKVYSPTSKIEATYQAVVEFIEYYNKQK